MTTNRITQRIFSALFAAAAAVLIAACGNTAPGNNTALDDLIAERDSLKDLRNQVEARISTIEEEIAALDTTRENILITTYAPQIGTFRHYFEVYGNAESDGAVSLYPEMPGLIQQIYVREGEEVRKGQVLIKLDAELVQRNINELQTSLELATTLYNKQKKLWEQNVGSEVQYLEAKNRKESLESSIATLKEQLSKASIRAPYDGVIDKIWPKVGEMANSQMPAVRLVNLDKVYITAEISERYIGKVKAGDPVVVVINRADTVLTEISRVGSFINQANRTFEIRLDVGSGLPNLKPNSLVMLKINDFTADSTLAIPSSLIMQDGDGQDYVFVVEQSAQGRKVARKRQISAGIRYMGSTLVLGGIEADKPIIDKGSRSVRDGDFVEIIQI